MILVEALSKNFGSVEALHSISFHVRKGEIIGLLGSNGAGKSTLLKILSTYLPPDAGRITIDGVDLLENPHDIRRRLGYLPEGAPLYPEMRVHEYLTYRAALKGVPARRIAEKMIDVMDLCSLRSVEKKLIGSLSKGYRQRVGLADALITEPPLLLFDEPTLGLDLTQQQQISHLLKGLAPRHTVLLSTHYMQEAIAICDRFLFLHDGKIVFFGTSKELQQVSPFPTPSEK
ncbi:MAG: ABC transporter ATP-binding protein [Verrucomicrobia bacterium]|nr:ABC transporter ATP-binding protein [Verrucomicrobiota bacterium]